MQHTLHATVVPQCWQLQKGGTDVSRAQVQGLLSSVAHSPKASSATSILSRLQWLACSVWGPRYVPLSAMLATCSIWGIGACDTAAMSSGHLSPTGDMANAPMVRRCATMYGQHRRLKQVQSCLLVAHPCYSTLDSKACDSQDMAGLSPGGHARARGLRGSA